MPTASECRAQALAMVGACESVDSFHRDLESLADCGMKSGPYADSVHDAMDCEEGALRGLASICNALSDELFDRERKCINYTYAMNSYRNRLARWEPMYKRWLSNPVIHVHPGSKPQPPDPPFPGAQEG